MSGMLARRDFWRGLVVAASMWAGVLIGLNIAKLSQLRQLDKVAAMLGVAILVGLKWGPFGYLCLLVALSPLELPQINLSAIPVFGWVFPWAPVRLQVVLLIGGAYLGALMLESLRQRKRWSTMPLLPLGIVVAYGALVALFFAWFPGQVEFESYTINFLYGAVVFLLVYSLVRTPRQLQTIATCMIVAGVLFCVLTLSLLTPMVSFYTYGASPTRLGGEWGIWTLPLGFTISASSNYLATYLALSNTLAWGQFLTTRTMRRRVLLLIAMGLMGYALLLTGSRTGVYGAVVGLAITTIIHVLSGASLSSPIQNGRDQRYNKAQKPKSSASKTLALFGLVVVFFIWGFSQFTQSSENPDVLLDRLLNPVYGKYSVFSGRVEVFMASLDIDLHYPAGSGVQAVDSVVGVVHHSLYTLALASLGWIGFGAFIWLCGWCTVQYIRGAKATDPAIRALSVPLLGATVAVVMMGFGHLILITGWGVTLFWTLLGLAAAMNRNRMWLETSQ